MTLSCPDPLAACTNDLPRHVVERVHAELAILYAGALLGMAGSMGDLLCSAGVEDDQAHDEAGTVLRRSLAEARELLSCKTGQAFEAIVEAFVRDARVAAPDGSSRAPQLLERILRAAH
jgi:hypothetical protein